MQLDMNFIIFFSQCQTLHLYKYQKSSEIANLCFCKADCLSCTIESKQKHGTSYSKPNRKLIQSKAVRYNALEKDRTETALVCCVLFAI